MRRKKSTKVYWFASAAFVGLMLTLSAVLYITDGSPARAESQSAVINEAIQLQELEMSDDAGIPLSAITPEDLITLDTVSLDDLGDMQNQQVPEPASLSLLGLGGLALLRRRRKNK